jgi:two-component system sensor histidine kinase YesM
MLLYKITVYKKIIIIFLLVVFPVFILSLSLNVVGKNKVTDEVVNVLSSKVDFCITSLEKDINRMLLFMQYYSNNRNLINLSERNGIMGSYEMGVAVSSITNDLLIYKHTLNYVENISVYIRNYKRIVSTIDMLYDPEEGYIREMLDYYFQLQGKAIALPTEDGIIVPYPINLFWKKNEIPVFFFVADLSDDELKKMLNESFMTEYMGAVMYSNDSPWQIYGGDPKKAAPVLETLKKETSPVAGKTLCSISIEGKDYLVISQFSNLLDIVLAVYIEKSYITGYTRPLQNWFWALLVFAIVMIAVFSFWLFRLVHQPFRRLVNSFGVIENGEIDIRMEYDKGNEFDYLYSRVEILIGKYKEAVKNFYEEKIYAQQVELKLLQSQIKPHFFYNILFVLRNLLTMQDVENAIKLCKYMGDYFRYNVRNMTDCLTLENEVNHAISYVNIQSFRYMDKIKATFGQIPEKYKNMEVPGLLLQPVVENCYKHGFSDTMGEGLIYVDFAAEDQSFVISVTDNGKGFCQQQLEYLNGVFQSNHKASDISGIINVNRRIQLKYGQKSGLKIINNQDCGATVKIIIVLDREWNHV